jgi:uncharacterized protein DUF6510
MTESPHQLDGNTLAGPLSSIFACDLTTAIAQCAGCGRGGPMARATVYGAPMGLIARCAGCGQALLRYARTPGGTALDMRGIALLRFGTPTDT